MKRGFKAFAEREAIKLRDECGLSTTDKIDAIDFVTRHGIHFLEVGTLLNEDPDALKQLTMTDPDSWSGLSVRAGGLIGVIINPMDSVLRQRNTIIHEWAHIYLRHKPSQVDVSKTGIMLLSDYPAEFEEEADWLAGALLAPREGLLKLLRNGNSVEAIAATFEISRQLAEWRIRMTGVRRQLKI